MVRFIILNELFEMCFKNYFKGYGSVFKYIECELKG